MLGVCLFVVAFCIASYAGETRYVEIKKPFVSVYQFLDPTSKIIVQASRNDHFELVYEGTSWYQIKVKDEVGWVEKSAGIIITNPGSSFMGVPMNTFIFFLMLLVATIIGASYLIYKQKSAEL